MFKRVIQTLLALLLLSGGAFAQTQVYQGGAVTPRDPVMWTAQRYVGDGTLNGGFSQFTITNSLPSFNYYDALQSTGNYHLLQLGANSTSNAALISYSAVGSVSTQPLLFTINGGTISLDNSTITLGSATAVAGTLNVAGSVSSTLTSLTQGQLVFGGATTGSATLKVMGNAGTPTIILPSTNGSVSGQPWIWNGTSSAASYAAVSGISGSAETFLLLDGPATNGHCPQFDSSGGVVDSGASCASSGVGAGVSGNLPWYSVTGSAVVGNLDLNVSNAALTIGRAGTSQASLAMTGAVAGTFTQAVPATISSYTITWPSAAPATGQTLLASNGTGTLAWGSSSYLTFVDCQSSSFNAVSGNIYCVDTSSAAVTGTLPASPTAGMIIGFSDASGTFATNNLTLARNGNNIVGLAANLAVNSNYATLTLRWSAVKSSWILSQ